MVLIWTDTQVKNFWDFPGGPVVKTSSSNAEVAGSIPGQGLRFHMPHSQNTKTENRSSIITSSIKTFKMIHIKKVFQKKSLKHWGNIELCVLGWEGGSGRVSGGKSCKQYYNTVKGEHSWGSIWKTLSEDKQEIVALILSNKSCVPTSFLGSLVNMPGTQSLTQMLHGEHLTCLLYNSKKWVGEWITEWTRDSTSYSQANY